MKIVRYFPVKSQELEEVHFWLTFEVIDSWDLLCTLFIDSSCYGTHRCFVVCFDSHHWILVISDTVGHPAL